MLRQDSQTEAKHIWNELVMLHETKLGKINFTRWFQFVSVANTFMKNYSQRMFIMMHAALELGLLDGKSWGTGSILDGRLKDKTKDGKQAMSMDELAQLRKCTKNSLHLSIVVLSDAMTKPLLHLILECLQPLLIWYQHQEMMLRSCEESQKWLMSQVATDFATHLCNIMAVLANQSSLERMDCTQFVPSDPDGHVAAETVRRATRMCKALVLQRLKRFLFVVVGWSIRSCLLAHASAEVRLSIAQEIENDARHDETAQKLTGMFWNKVNRRSVFQTTAVLQVVLGLRRRNGVVDDAVQKHARESFQCIAASKGSEDGICVLRRMEEVRKTRLV